MTSKSILTTTLACLGLLSGSPASFALIFFDTADPAHNREVAPGGTWAGSGWQYQGLYRSFLGTMISPRHFVTAKHVSIGETTFLQKSYFSGTSNRTYYINPNANGGVGFWNIAGTDLRIFEVYGDFDGYAELYTKSNEAGKETVMMGRGLPRGAPQLLSAETRGWRWGSDDKRARWGVNNVDYTINDPSVGSLLVTDFDEAPGTDECSAAAGDSGGALFIKDLGTWKLGGILYAVDGQYDTNTICGDSSGFSAAMFNALGFYIGSDNAECTGWNPVTSANDQTRSYASRISSSASVMQAIIQGAIDDAAKTPLERYEEWIAGFGLGSETLPGEDADHDWQPNAVEYLAALNPDGVDAPSRALLVEEVAGKIRFTVRIRLDAAARGLSWEIQGTNDLEAQSYVAVTGLTQAGLTRSLSGGVETIQFEITQPAGLRMFYRLEVTLAP
ncbi:MAG: hypothetical protein VCA34_01970 [Roseibacillus sp.]